MGDNVLKVASVCLSVWPTNGFMNKHEQIKEDLDGGSTLMSVGFWIYKTVNLVHVCYTPMY